MAHVLLNYERGVLNLDYVIRNHKNVYIKLNKQGSPVTCTEQDKTCFEYSKANNILKSLPKTLKRLNFKVDPVPEIGSKESKSNKDVIIKDDKRVPNEVTRWIEKFGICDDVIQEARERKEELVAALSNTDRELSNTLHKIELQKSKNACEGFKEYKALKELLEKRRNIKDELMIISDVLRMDFRNFDGESVNKAVTGLVNRKFTMRFVEEDDEDAV